MGVPSLCWSHWAINQQCCSFEAYLLQILVDQVERGEGVSCCTQPPSPTPKYPTGSECWGGGNSQARCWMWVGCLLTIPGLTRPLHLELPSDEGELSGSLRSSSGVEVYCDGVEPGKQLPLLLSFCQLSVLVLTVRQSWNLEVFCIRSEGSQP